MTGILNGEVKAAGGPITKDVLFQAFEKAMEYRAPTLPLTTATLKRTAEQLREDIYWALIERERWPNAVAAWSFANHEAYCWLLRRSFR